MSTAHGDTSGHGGVAIQLAARGQAAWHLNGKPEVTHWRHRHQPYTNFAIDQVVETFSTSQFGSTGRVELSRAGDLVHRQYVVITLPGITTTVLGNTASNSPGYPFVKTTSATDGAGGVEEPYIPAYEYQAGINSPLGGFWSHWVNAIGYRIVGTASLKIGQLVIDQVTSEYLYAASELMGKAGKRVQQLVGLHETREQLIAWSANTQLLWVPLPWFFSHLSGNALSLASLPGNSVVVTVAFAPLARCIVVSHRNITAYKGATGADLANTDLDATLLTEYVFLEEAERTVFDSKPVDPRTGMRPHGPPNYDQLITTVQQYSLETSGSTAATLSLHQNFSNPAAELIFCARLHANDAKVGSAANTGANDWTNFSRCGPSETGASGYADTHEHRFPMPIQTEGTFDLRLLDENLDTAIAGVDIINTNGNVTGADIFNLGNSVICDADIFNTCSLEVNGSHRWPSATGAKYFRTVQPYQHHSCIPRNYIYMYAFGLHPESASPSGALNITRLSSMTLTLTFKQTVFSVNLGNLTVFAWVRAYNVLRYRKGSAGLQYGATV